MKDSKYYILYLVSKLLECLEISVVYNNSKMFRERMLLVLRHKIGDIIYFYDITAAKGGPSLSSFIPPCDSEIVDHTLCERRLLHVEGRISRLPHQDL